jgi:hypothetical protein
LIGLLGRNAGCQNESQRHCQGEVFLHYSRFLEIEVEMIDAELPLTKAAKVGKAAATRKTSR